MFLIIGLVLCIGSILGGFIMHGGNLGALIQPSEFIIIGGAALFSFVAANSPATVKAFIPGIIHCLKGSGVSKETFKQLLGLMAEIFNVIRKEGVLGIEGDISNPHESARFKKYPAVLHNHHLVELFVGALRLFVDGVVNAFDLERLMDAELEAHHEEAHTLPAAVKNMADALPAFGIVAAVLGVILTMQYLDQPPTVIGQKVAAALVGTMLGIYLSYGLVGPIASAMENIVKEEAGLYKCVQAGLVAFAGGSPPQVALEFARKTIPPFYRPTSEELEQIIKASKS
jgi:chemotaxis protein MotA